MLDQKASVARQKGGLQTWEGRFSKGVFPAFDSLVADTQEKIIICLHFGSIPRCSTSKMTSKTHDTPHELSDCELHFLLAWPLINSWKIRNHEAEKELYAKREAMMLVLRRVFQQNLLEKSFTRWAQEARVLPPDLLDSSDDE